MTKIADLVHVDVSHQLNSLDSTPAVVLRCKGTGALLLGHLTPAQARQIAADLLDSAARADYESDLVNGLTEAGFTPEQRAAIVTILRNGETTRRQNGGPRV